MVPPPAPGSAVGPSLRPSLRSQARKVIALAIGPLKSAFARKYTRVSASAASSSAFEPLTPLATCQVPPPSRL